MRIRRCSHSIDLNTLGQSDYSYKSLLHLAASLWDSGMPSRFALRCLVVLGCWLPFDLANASDLAPNFVLIYAEDIGVELECYGHPAVETPVLDKLAEEGTRYTHAFCTGPSCTPSRNAMITGVYQTRTGTQDQRRGGVTLIDGVEPITAPLRRSGYHCAIGCGYSDKTDFNFVNEKVFDSNDWSHRQPGQPFFAQITLGVTHRHPGVGWTKIRAASESPVESDQVQLPPYFPDTPECRLDWAGYLDSIEAMDRQVGEILDRIDREGLSESTVVIFMGDNGRCHLRGKCWLYDAGLHVPLVVRYLDSQLAGTIDVRMHSAIDVAATILSIAEVEFPEVFDGEPLVGADASGREAIFAARDLIDEVRDPMRAVRTERYKYIRNYRPENGYAECQYVQDNRPMLSVIRRLDAEGRLTPAQELIVATRKPREELYDLEYDPYEIANLAGDDEYVAVLAKLRSQLDEWLSETGDTGLKLYQANSR